MSVASLRYVVLRHADVATPHFDLLFEWEAGDALTSFRCPAWPPHVGDEWTEAADHRRAYLDYEGAISGDRGVVTRIAAGSIKHEVLVAEPPTLALRTEAGDAIVIIQRSERGIDAWVVESTGA